MPTARAARRSGPDAFESEAVPFHRRLREGFLAQAAECPERWLVLDGTLPVEELAERVWERAGRMA